MNANNDNKAYDWRSFVTSTNFELSPLEESTVNIFWENMRDKAPSRASIRLVLEKTPTGHQAVWTIQSFDLIFEAKGEAAELKDVLQDLQHQLSSQLTEWKKSRFNTVGASL